MRATLQQLLLQTTACAAPRPAPRGIASCRSQPPPAACIDRRRHVRSGAASAARHTAATTGGRAGLCHGRQRAESKRASVRLSASWYGRAFNTDLGPIRASTCGALCTVGIGAAPSSEQTHKHTNKQTNKQTNRHAASDRPCLVEQLAVLRAQLVELLLRHHHLLLHNPSARSSFAVSLEQPSSQPACEPSVMCVCLQLSRALCHVCHSMPTAL